MKIHKLKIFSRFYDAVENGQKNFELRKMDRDYQVGDILCLREWSNEKYTGRECYKRITYVLEDYVGLTLGFCILGLTDTEKSKIFSEK